MKANIQEDLKFILLQRGVRLCFVNLLFGILLMISLTSCNGIITRTPTMTPITTVQQSEPIRPEPQEPHIRVSFSGLDGSALGYLYVRTLGGHVAVWGSRPGDGEKRVVLPERQGIIYSVTAESEGYVSDPLNYTIQLNGDIFYMVKNGQATSEEISVLNFKFTPISTPTGD